MKTLESDRPGFELELSYVVVVWLWINDLTELSLIFVIYKTRQWPPPSVLLGLNKIIHSNLLTVLDA